MRPRPASIRPRLVHYEGLAASRRLELCSAFTGRTTSVAPNAGHPTAAHQPKDQKKHHRTYEGIDDKGNDPSAKMDAEARQQPITDKCTDQANNQVADQSKATTRHYSAGKPSRDNADDQDDEETLIGEMHGQPQAKPLVK